MLATDRSAGGTAPSFAVIPGTKVRQVLAGQERRIAGLIEHAYRLHGAGATVNPPSYFLTFPERPAQRIIALPASVGGDVEVDGVKWISSVPANVAAGLPRASAVIVLNEPRTGYPLGCLEASIISATRTAASATLAADWLSRDRGRPATVAFVGTGLIARYIHTHLAGTGWQFTDIGIFDLNAGHAEAFAGYLTGTGGAARVTIRPRPEDAIRSADLVVFATVASTPHVHEAGWFAHNPLVLHISLRDLAPELILGACNVVDDIEHCLKAATSVHLAEQLSGGRTFLSGTLYDVMTGSRSVARQRPVVFSPFGLGVLDLVLAKFVYDELDGLGELARVDGFFAELERYGDGVLEGSRRAGD